MLGEDGQKMSKSKRNYREPSEILDKYGADALRWYFFANQPPWTPIRYNEQAIKESIPEFLLRLWHTYSFFVIYATIDGFDPAARIVGEAGQLSAAELSAGKGYRLIGKAQRAGPVDLERTGPYRGRRDRADGCLRQLCGLSADHRIRRRPEQLVRAPQPRPLLGARARKSPTSWMPIGRCMNAC